MKHDVLVPVRKRYPSPTSGTTPLCKRWVALKVCFVVSLHKFRISITVFAEINVPGAQFLEAIRKHSKTHQNPLVLCTPPFEKAQFLVGSYFGVGIYFGKYGVYTFDNAVSLGHGLPAFGADDQEPRWPTRHLLSHWQSFRAENHRPRHDALPQSGRLPASDREPDRPQFLQLTLAGSGVTA